MEYFVEVWDGDNPSVEKGLITSIKEGTFHYNATNGTPGKLRLGNVCSSYCEFDYYTGGDFEIEVGDVFDFRYNTLLDKYFNNQSSLVSATDPNNDGNVILSGFTATDDGTGNVSITSDVGATDDGTGNIVINGAIRTIISETRFFVNSVNVKRGIAHVVGYDCVYFLEVDYSQRLKQLESSFPMSIDVLLNDIGLYCGVPVYYYTAYYDSYSLVSSKINYFYVEGITARTIVQYIADMIAFDYVAMTNNSGTTYLSPSRDIGTARTPGNNWWGSLTYVICPDDGTYVCPDGTTPATNVWYKENSLDINPDEIAYDGVEYVSSSGVSLGHYYSSGSPQNIYYITGNPLIDNIVPSTMPHTFDYYAENILTGNTFTPTGFGLGINNAFPYSAATVDIFNFRNPYINNCLTRFVDTDGNYHNFPMMSIDITDDRVHIESYGREVGYNANSQSGIAQKAPPIWIFYTLHDGTYGKMTMAINRTSGIGIIRWVGNGNVPSGPTRITASLAPYKSFLNGLNAWMYRGNQLHLADSNGNWVADYVSAELIADGWSFASLVFPLDQS